MLNAIQLRGTDTLPLFKGLREDLYPNFIYDTSTTNRSFVRYAKTLEKAGIENAGWALVLLQPCLQGVDPHSPNLTKKQQDAIAFECKWNPVYWFREVARIDAVSETGCGPFGAHRMNMALIFCYFCSVTFLGIAPRQFGKTTGLIALDYYLMLFWNQGVRTNMMTIKISNGQDAITKMKVLRKNTPPYLIVKSFNDGDGREKIRNASKDCEWGYIVHANAELDADAKGRGLTSKDPRVDEFAYIRHLKKTLNAALPGSTTAGLQAENARLPHGIILITTAGELDTPSGRHAYDIATSGLVWTEKLLDLKSRQEVKIAVDNGSGDTMSLIYGSFNHIQLGRTNEWLRQVRKDNGFDRATIEKDFLNIWRRGSSSGLLTAEQSEKVNQSVQEPLYCQITPEGYVLRWYIPEKDIAHYMARRKTVLGVDTSDGIGRDGIGLLLIDTLTGETVMATSINEINLITMIRYVCDILVKYENILMNIEKKSSAQSFIAQCLLIMPALGINPFFRIYNRIVENKETMLEEFREIDRPAEQISRATYDKYAKYFGFNTTGDSRSQLYGSVLSMAVNTSARLVKDQRLSMELLGLVVKNSRIDHNSTGHDDMVISWLLAHWTLLHGKNLDCYGIESKDILQMVGADGGRMSAEELRSRTKADLIRKEIDVATDIISKTENAYVIAQQEQRLRMLVERLNGVSSETVSINNLINDLRESKADRRKAQRKIKCRLF